MSKEERTTEDRKLPLPAATQHVASSLDPVDAQPSRTPSAHPSNGDEPASPETEYILSEDLKPLQGDISIFVDVSLSLLFILPWGVNLLYLNHCVWVQNLPQRLDSKDWICVCEALNYTRQLATFHSASLTQILYVSALVKLIAFCIFMHALKVAALFFYAGARLLPW